MKLPLQINHFLKYSNFHTNNVCCKPLPDFPAFWDHLLCLTWVSQLRWTLDCRSRSGLLSSANRRALMPMNQLLPPRWPSRRRSTQRGGHGMLNSIKEIILTKWAPKAKGLLPSVLLASQCVLRQKCGSTLLPSGTVHGLHDVVLDGCPLVYCAKVRKKGWKQTHF